MKKMKESEFLSTAQLAKLMKMSRVAVLKRIHKGNVKAIKVGRNFVIRRSDITHLLKNMQ